MQSKHNMAIKAFHKLVSYYDAVIPSALKSLLNNINSFLTIYFFANKEWINICITNR